MHVGRRRCPGSPRSPQPPGRAWLPTQSPAIHQPRTSASGDAPGRGEFVPASRNSSIKEEHRQRPRGGIQNLADAQNLGVEARDAALQRNRSAGWTPPPPAESAAAAARARERRPAPSTALIPSVRSSVLLPDMLEPLTISTCGLLPRRRSLRTACSAGRSGWQMLPPRSRRALHELRKGIGWWSKA